MPNLAQQNPVHFLESVRAAMCLKNDAALARTLKVAPPVISKIRHGRNPVTPALMIKLLDASDLSLAELRTRLYHPVEDQAIL